MKPDQLADQLAEMAHSLAYAYDELDCGAATAREEEIASLICENIDTITTALRNTRASDSQDVERVARALREFDCASVPEGILGDEERDGFYRRAARAAIAALSPNLPEGM